MAYLYKKVIGGKPYYYLRVSVRNKERVIAKDVAYLGSSLDDVEQALKKRPEKEVRKAYKTLKRFLTQNTYLERVKKPKADPYLPSVLLAQVEAAHTHFDEVVLKLDTRTQEEFFRHFLIEFAFNTTSIEGNTITLKETHKLLEEELLPKDKTLREVYDLQNTEKVFFALRERPPEITQTTIIDIHDRLMDRIDERKGLRSHDVRVFRSTFETTPVAYLQTDLKLLFTWFEKHKGTLHPLALGSIFHHKLERIHPFADGNGRTGRMLLNLILLKHGYPPLIVPKRRRKEYLAALKNADSAELPKSGTAEYAPLITFIAQELVTSYWENFLV